MLKKAEVKAKELILACKKSPQLLVLGEKDTGEFFRENKSPSLYQLSLSSACPVI